MFNRRINERRRVRHSLFIHHAAPYFGTLPIK